jgi:uncharacterized protein (TIGR02266 family)
VTDMSEEYTAAGVTASLFDLIRQMPVSEQEELLNCLRASRRRYERRPYITTIEYSTRHGSFTDFSLDIGAGGIFLETFEDLDVGEELILTLTLPGHDAPLKISGRVHWRGPAGVGVRFEHMSREQIELLESFVRNLGNRESTR